MSESGLRRLVYASRSRIGGGAAAVAVELAAILESARRRNEESGVTGALVLRGRRFAQALEGPHAAVQEVFGRIAADVRHDEVTVVEDGPVPARAFPGWSMAYAGGEGSPDIPLTLVDAVRGTGEEAEVVLGRLRALTER